MVMKVLIVGSGGREAAIAWAVKRSPRLGILRCAPGNAGIAQHAECLPIPAEDVEFLDAYARDHRVPSRSGVVHRAIRLLRDSELSSDYAAAFAEAADDPEDEPWDNLVSDGLTGA